MVRPGILFCLLIGGKGDDTARASVLAHSRAARNADDGGGSTVPALRRLPGEVGLFDHYADRGIRGLRGDAAGRVSRGGPTVELRRPQAGDHRGAGRAGGRDGVLPGRRLGDVAVRRADGPRHRDRPRDRRAQRGAPGVGAARQPGPRASSQQCRPDDGTGRWRAGVGRACGIRPSPDAVRLLDAARPDRDRAGRNPAGQRARAAPAGCAGVPAPSGRRAPRGAAGVRGGLASARRPVGAWRFLPGARPRWPPPCCTRRAWCPGAR